MGKTRWKECSESYHQSLDWEEFDLKPLEFDWELTVDDLQFSMPFGIQMENAVITKPYSIIH